MKNISFGAAPIIQSIRIDSLDLYKGLAILMVVAGHLVQLSTPDFDKSLLFKGIYLFHMPLFFLLSGMVYSIKPASVSATELKNSVLKRARQLLFPFFSWFLVYHFVTHSAVPPSVHFLELLKSPDVGLWFLWVLFVFSCLADLGRIVARVTRTPLWLFGAVAWAVFFHLKIHFYVLGLGLIAFHLPFFFAGIFHKQIVSAVGKSAAALTAACSVAFPFAVYFWDRLNPPQVGLLLQQKFSLPMSTALYTVYLAIGYLYQAAFSVVGIVVFFAVVNAFSEADDGMNRAVARWLCFIGRRTLELYVLHGYFIQYMYASAGPFMNGLIAMVLATGLSILIADYLLKPNRVFALVLFGKPLRSRLI